MKDFFKNKTNIILVTVLVLLCSLTVYLFVMIYGPKNVVAIDFSNLTEQEILEWKKSNELSDDVFSISYQYNEEVEKDKVCYQSVKEGDSITNGISIIISNGPDPDLEIKLPNISEMDYEKMKEWLDNNKFSNYHFAYVLDDEHEKNAVLNINVQNSAKRSDEIIIFISAGNGEDDPNITVPDFKSYSIAEINEWGEANRINIKINYVLSSTYASGTIIEQSLSSFSEISIGSTITITISQGVGITMKDFYNSTRSNVEIWCKENNIKASYYYVESNSVSENRVVSTEPKAGILIGSGDSIKVYLAKEKENKETVIVDGDRLNKTEKEFVEYIKSLGLNPVKGSTEYFSTTIIKGNVFSYDDGEFDKGSNINYNLSAGPYTFVANEYNGKSKGTVNSLISEYNNRNAHISVKFNEVETNKYNEGITFDCKSSKNGINTNVTCSIAKKESGSEPSPSPSPSPSPTPSSSPSPTLSPTPTPTPTPEQENYIGTKLLYSSPDGYDATLELVNRNLGVFDLTIVDGFDEVLASGQIISISVGNYGTAYDPGLYPISTEVVVVINKK